MSEAEAATKTTSLENQNTLETIREDLVTTAIKFLENPRVAARPQSEKEVFLERKGLTKAEILAAFEASNANNAPDHTVKHYSAVEVSQVRGFSSGFAPPPKSRWAILRDILNAIVLIGGASYSIHYIYKRFIAPWLFNHKKEKSLPKMVEEMNKNLTCLVSDLAKSVKDLSFAVSKLHDKQNNPVEVKELKAEVASLKALLLSRRQFPAPPALVAGPPSIPSWQLGSSGADMKGDMRKDQITPMSNDGMSLSSSPEIISVEDIPPTNGGRAETQMRDPSESSESNSAEMVDMGASASGGSGEDTD